MSEISASVAIDGVELVTLAHDGRRRELGTMLEHPWWLTFSDDGQRLAFVRGPYREAWLPKSLVSYNVRTTVSRTITRPGELGLDPAWRPHSHEIAYVRADANLGSDGGYGSNFFSRWLPARKLWLADADRGMRQRLPAFGSGVFWPMWSKDGRWLMVYRAGAVVLGELGSTAVRAVVSGLLRPAEAQAYFLGEHGAVDADASPVAWTG